MHEQRKLPPNLIDRLDQYNATIRAGALKSEAELFALQQLQEQQLYQQKEPESSDAIDHLLQKIAVIDALSLFRDLAERLDTQVKAGIYYRSGNLSVFPRGTHDANEILPTEQLTGDMVELNVKGAYGLYGYKRKKMKKLGLSICIPAEGDPGRYGFTQYMYLCRFMPYDNKVTVEYAASPDGYQCFSTEKPITKSVSFNIPRILLGSSPGFFA
ncbi:hypothetical protein C4564_05475 [Candidatus Microgenomates bacterium]|nr:MAG: hypothetical protein C4564_05475 [Candidatus Microgenomates bacterium]